MNDPMENRGPTDIITAVHHKLNFVIFIKGPLNPAVIGIEVAGRCTGLVGTGRYSVLSGTGNGPGSKGAAIGDGIINRMDTNSSTGCRWTGDGTDKEHLRTSGGIAVNNRTSRKMSCCHIKCPVIEVGVPGISLSFIDLPNDRITGTTRIGKQIAGDEQFIVRNANLRIICPGAIGIRIAGENVNILSVSWVIGFREGNRNLICRIRCPYQIHHDKAILFRVVYNAWVVFYVAI